MDTKLKNNNKRGNLLTVIVLLISSVGMLLFYPAFSSYITDQDQKEMRKEEQMLDMLDPILYGNYLLYNEISNETESSEVIEEYGNSRFGLMKKYMKYGIFDESGTAMLTSDESAKKLPEEFDSDTYALCVRFSFDFDGDIFDIQVGGTVYDKKLQFTAEQWLYDNSVYSEAVSYISTPSEVDIIYAMTEQNLSAYLEQYETSNDAYAYMYVDELMQQSSFNWAILLFTTFSAAAAFLIPQYKKRVLEKDAIVDPRRCPLEIAFIIGLCLMAYVRTLAIMIWNTCSHKFIQVFSASYGENLNDAISLAANAVIWFVYFTVVYWLAGCVREIFVLKKSYLRERSLCVKFLLWLKNGGNSMTEEIKKLVLGCWRTFKAFCRHQYEALLHIDFRDNTNKTILRIVLLNFAVIFVISMFWMYGIWVLIIYSVGLFIFLRKYLNKVQEQYQGILKSTNQLAEGNLDFPITGDVGIFAPVQNELKRIQTGFKKAVSEEVKSERMKTDLITNVSHDLKTPLTAIITYVDLVKNETDEEKRKEYIGVLERKSLRLKVLIEDLFEISKATSRTVTLHYMKIDIVDLLKQVGLEYDSNIRNANLEMKWNLPEHKIVLWLDSQKTYRIFENMIVNITKYAMPHTRVYIDMKETEQDVRISMKNVSSAELNFNTDEITDRFVRGDVSRNTEGSGLGLAIVKSFVELQHGTLQISTEADLFKAEIVFPKRQEVPDGENETGM